jgi:hypothetical protein
MSLRRRNRIVPRRAACAGARSVAPSARSSGVRSALSMKSPREGAALRRGPADNAAFRRRPGRAYKRAGLDRRRLGLLTPREAIRQDVPPSRIVLSGAHAFHDLGDALPLHDLAGGGVGGTRPGSCRAGSRRRGGFPGVHPARCESSPASSVLLGASSPGRGSPPSSDSPSAPRSWDSCFAAPGSRSFGPRHRHRRAVGGRHAGCGRGGLYQLTPPELVTIARSRSSVVAKRCGSPRLPTLSCAHQVLPSGSGVKVARGVASGLALL